MGNKFADWPEEYARRLLTPDEAARLVRNGDNIGIPVGALVPTVVAAIYARHNELADVDVYACAPTTDPGWWTTPSECTWRCSAPRFRGLRFPAGRPISPVSPSRPSSRAATSEASQSITRMLR